MMRIRHYSREDYPTLLCWWKERGMIPIDMSIIPISSCIVEDDAGPVAFASVYPCNNNPVAFVHGLILKPGMGLSKSKQAATHLIEGLDIICRQGGHTVMLSSVKSPRLVRGAEMLGFTSQGIVAYPVSRQVSLQPNT